MNRWFFFLLAFFLSLNVPAQSISNSTSSSISSSAISGTEWKPQLFWSGDLRYRLAKTKESIDEDRTYHQLRARLGLKTEVNEDLLLYFRMATGTSATSTNQSLGDSRDPGMPRRGFGLDLAYIEWKWNSKGRTWLGRTPNPFWSPGKNQMIFDSDLVFEGLALKTEAQWAPFRLQLNLGSSMISENYDSSARVDVVDTGIAGGQMVASLKTEIGDLSFHYSHIEFVNIQDKNITSIDVNAKIDTYSNPFNRFKGNSVDRPDPLVASYFYHNKFVLISTGGEWKWSFGDYEILAFYDWVDNYQASRVSTAIEKGGALRWGRSQIQYAQISKEAESVVGAFTDSDSNGGGTDNRGQRLTYLYQLSEHSQIAYSLFEAQRGQDTVRRDFIASSLDFIVWF